MRYTVNQVAQLAGVTPRTLRYYDKIGLLTPSEKTEAGYRIYYQEDMERLQQILFFRELDFPLAKIMEILKNPAFDRREALRMQVEFLEKKAERYRKLSHLAAETLSTMEGGHKMADKDLFEAFDYEKMMEDQKQYEDEVKKRWGDTAAYKESMAKTSKYNKEDWEQINEVQVKNYKELVDLYKEGLPCDDPRVQEIVDRSRKFISENFYQCPVEVFGGLGEMYVSDERFKAFYENLAPGLAGYYNQAIQHYCRKETEKQEQ